MRRWMMRLPPCALLLSALTGPAVAQPAPKVDFAHEIVPLLKARCGECHTAGKYKGSFSLDTREEVLKKQAVVPGKSAASELIRRVTSKDAQERMPAKGPPLTTQQIELLTIWIDQGFGWEEGFSFRAGTYVVPLKPRRPTLPPARAGRDHPIDRILDAYFAKNKLAWPAPLDDTALVRRIYLDVIGLLPTPEEATAFERDASADKCQRLVCKLLGEKRGYADHWLTFWNDLLRNDYSGTGYIDGGRTQISGWLYASLLNNKPYNLFVRELISPTAASEGFIKGIKWRGNVNASQVPELQFSQNVSQVFFGINLKCASCHDSFIDRWKLDDAYALAAVIAERRLELHRCDKPTGTFASARFIFPELGKINAKEGRAKRLEELAGLVTHSDNGRFARCIANRIWQRLLGRGIVHPVDVMANTPWLEDLLDYLGVYLAEQRYDLKKLIEHIATSRAYQSRPTALADEPAGDEYIFRGPLVRRMTAEQFMDAVWMLTRTAPEKAAAPVQLPAFAEAVPRERRFVRAALVSADPLQRSLGRPNREQVVTTRPDQLSTLQALDLSNGEILTQTLERGARNMLKDQPKATPEQRIEKIYMAALCRLPTRVEMAAARASIGSSLTADALADLLWAVLMLPEFQLIR
jgi:hypothetical protein